MSADLLAVDPVTAARLLLGAVITGRGVSALIVEVEAYGGPPDGPWPDAAAHSFRGPSTRNAVMFGPPGRLYTYRSHGIHVCANVACGPDGTAAAVLLRAAAVESGVEFAAARRDGVLVLKDNGRAVTAFLPGHAGLGSEDAATFAAVLDRVEREVNRP